MHVVLLCLIYSLIKITFCPALEAATIPVPNSQENDAGWSTMPAGARSAYMGIHGGTMPVSLLVVADGSSLLGFVGRTGSDFLDVLRNSKLAFLGRLVFNESTDEEEPAQNSVPPSSAGGNTSALPDKISFSQNSLFVTGSGLSSLPVIQMNGSLPISSPYLEQLLPFGFSQTPLSIEGQVTPPAKTAPKRQYRLVFEPQHLQPR